MIRTERIPLMNIASSTRPSVPALSVPDALRIATIGAQVAGLWAFSAGGSWIAAAAHLPIPGNVIGMCALFALLLSGAIKADWLDLGGGVLTKHLAFFFVPLTVGLMGFGSLFEHEGIAIVVTLVVSAAVGLVVAGHTTQLLGKARK